MRHQSYGRRTTDVTVCVGGLRLNTVPKTVPRRTRDVQDHVPGAQGSDLTTYYITILVLYNCEKKRQIT
jgi:hypothetical protein